MEGKRFLENNRTLVTNYNLYLSILNGFKLLEKLKTKQLLIEINNNYIPLNGICTYYNNPKLKYVLVKH